jgi:hypothetical protein
VRVANDAKGHRLDSHNNTPLLVLRLAKCSLISARRTAANSQENGSFPRKRLRRNLDAIQVDNLSAASFARNHVQVSLVICSQVANDSELL